MCLRELARLTCKWFINAYQGQSIKFYTMYNPCEFNCSCPLNQRMKLKTQINLISFAYAKHTDVFKLLKTINRN